MLSLRLITIQNQQTKEFLLFSFQKESKSWITLLSDLQPIYVALVDQISNKIYLYNRDRNYVTKKSIGNLISPELLFADVLLATGLFIKHDSTIPLLSFSFNDNHVFQLFSLHTDMGIGSERKTMACRISK